jgi:steroid 5-alpha-reductase/3-oxo-5-alpha-steroid 4-dehydrogenase 1
MLMEAPSALGFLAVYSLGAHRMEAVPLASLALWQAHYAHRAFVFPWRLRERGKRMPFVIVGMGLFFNCVNTWLNARWISDAGSYDASWFTDPRFVAGMALFATGYGVNQHADAVLFALRPYGEAGYRIPFGGLYRWVSCPNYLGEILEWSGWALATDRWYRRTFADYPPERKALVPFVL